MGTLARIDVLSQHQRMSMLFPPLPVRRDERADDRRDDGIHQPIIDGPAYVASFELGQAIFRKLHSPGLCPADQHVHLDFEPAKFLEHFALKVIIGYAHYQPVRRGFVNIVSSHKGV